MIGDPVSSPSLPTPPLSPPPPGEGDAGAGPGPCPRKRSSAGRPSFPGGEGGQGVGSGARRAAYLCATLLVALTSPAHAQTTRPERTAFRETSTYADVLGFLDSLQKAGAGIRVWELGRSPQGRSIPVVLAARPMVASAEAAHASGKPIVYLQANIHAGEVDGKEAAQMLLRDLTVGPLQALLDKVVLLVVPIYNTDGNEDFQPGEVNRPGQNGPALVGRNTNGQGLNLNRDYVKLEAPETRASIDLLDRWEPHLFVDLHTTNGSYHGYALTWAPGLNANVTPASAWVRDRFLPEIQRRMQKRHGLATFPYGNFRNQDPDSLKLGWETYDGRARYGTNWAGLRGRLSILSESYSNDPFERRIHATYEFVHEILALLAERRDEALAQVTPQGARPDSVAVRSALAPPRMEKVVAELTRPADEGSGGYARRVRTGKFKTIRMPVFDRFQATRTEAIPAGYLIPDRLQEVVALLRRQGIAVTELMRGWQVPTERFVVDSLARAPAKFEGHFTMLADGRWTADGPAAGKGDWYYVSTAQPLGRFAAYLLEPASEDGVVQWNFLDAELKPGRAYPILRTFHPIGGRPSGP